MRFSKISKIRDFLQTIILPTPVEAAVEDRSLKTEKCCARENIGRQC